MKFCIKEYFEANPKSISTALIYLRKVKFKDLQNLLCFMYQGEVNVAEVDLSGFLEVGEDLNVTQPISK